MMGILLRRGGRVPNLAQIEATEVKDRLLPGVPASQPKLSPLPLALDGDSWVGGNLYSLGASTDEIG